MISILKQKNISLNKFPKISRKLQHASFGMPGGRGIFSFIQQKIDCIPSFIILKISIKKVLIDWHSILTQLYTQPNSVLQIVNELPSYDGYSYGLKLGAGGVWVSGMKN